MKKRLTAIVLMLAFFTSTSLAAGYQKSITADFDVRLTIDGQAVSLADAAGNAVQPFTYNGTTYVPIRAVADYLGAGVHYNSSTKTANVSIDAQDAAYFLHMLESESASYYIGCTQLSRDIGTDYANKDKAIKAYNADSERAQIVLDYHDALKTAGNKYNVAISLQNVILLRARYKDLLDAYCWYDDAKTSSEKDKYWNQFFDTFDEVIDTYYDCLDQIQDDFYTVCT